MPNKKIYVINSEGFVTKEQRSSEFNFGNFIPEIWENSKQKPLIVYSDNPSVCIYMTDIRTGNIVHKKINPFTECKVNGTIVGEFDVAELVSQSTIRPVIYNGRLDDVGVPDPEYFPTIGSIGQTTGTQIGIRSLEFKGSYQNQNVVGSCVQLPSFSTIGLTYCLMSGFVYMTEVASTLYSPIIFQKAPSSGGTTYAVFCLEINKYMHNNSQKDRVNFKWSDQGSTYQGFEKDLWCSPPAGITLNCWHSFAILSSEAEGYISTFWDGIQEDTSTDFLQYRNSSSPLSIGGGFTGANPLKGWISDLIISKGTASSKFRGENNDASSFTVPTKYQTSDQNTIYYMSMNGVAGTSIFPVEGNNRVVGAHSAVDVASQNIYISSVRYDSSVGVVFSGSSGGYTTGMSAGYIFGVRSGAAIIPSVVTELCGITLSKSKRIQSTEYTSRYALSSVVSGSTYDQEGQGWFKTLYGPTGGYTGGTLSFRSIDSNINKIKAVVDIWSRIPIYGTTFAYVDETNSTHFLGKTQANALYDDLLQYHSIVLGQEQSSISFIRDCNDLEQLRGSGTFDSEILSILARKIQYAPDLEIPVQYKILGNEIASADKNM